MLPTITVSGNVKSIEVKNVGGKNLTSFQVHCSEKKQNGEWDNLYLSCSVWEKASDFFNQYFKNGSAISVTGKLFTQSFKKQDGTNAYENKLLYTKVDFVPKDNIENEMQNHQHQQQNQSEYTTPPIDINSDEIPL